MKLNYRHYRENYQNYVLECLDSEDQFIDQEPTDQEKIEYLFNRFHSEYGHEINRVGKQSAMAEWLAGLAVNIPYWDEDIIDLAVEMGSIDEEPTEKQKETIVNNYFTFMASMILPMEEDIIQ